MSSDAGGGTMQPTQLTGRIDTTAWPKVNASCHQSLLVLRIAARLVNEFGRQRNDGVRNWRILFAPPRTCLSIILPKLKLGPLAAMPSALSGSVATGLAGLFQPLAPCHGLPSPTTPTAPTPTTSTCHALLLLRVCTASSTVVPVLHSRAYHQPIVSNKRGICAVPLERCKYFLV